MKKALLALFAIGFALSFNVSETQAQLFDHLECYRVKDPNKFDALVTLTPEQIPFAVDTACKVKLKAKEMCIPVEKSAVFTDAPGPGVTPSPLTGQPLVNDFLCYKMKCFKPAIALPPINTADQFSTRQLTKFRAKRICVPALKNCGAHPAPICNGICPVGQNCTDVGGVCGCL